MEYDVTVKAFNLRLGSAVGACGLQWLLILPFIRMIVEIRRWINCLLVLLVVHWCVISPCSDD